MDDRDLLFFGLVGASVIFTALALVLWAGYLHERNLDRRRVARYLHAPYRDPRITQAARDWRGRP